MKITSISVKNYRTIEDLTLSLKGTYVALSGKNNSGKSNVFRILSSIFGPIGRGPFYGEVEVRYHSDFPNWKKGSGGKIECSVTLELDPNDDAGLHRFVTEFVAEQPNATGTHTICICQSWTETSTDAEQLLSVNNVQVENKYRVAELFKKLRASRCVIFHDSTGPSQDFYYGRGARWMSEGLAPTDTEKVKKASETLRMHIQKSVSTHEGDVYSLLGRLSEKYKVTLSPPKLDFGDLPIQISLGERDQSVPLDEWGSGTQNRTLILLNLLRARRGKDKAELSDKITPILLIEEAECFLHPSAQAEFGALLQTLSSEFGVQVITTTHSPYMLSLTNPGANILLERQTVKGKSHGTRQVETEGEGWMEPFGTILGVSNDAFASWREILFKGSNMLILVEGATDAKYLELLRADHHGTKKLVTNAEIFAYEGTGFFSNTILVKFLLNRFKRVLITFDLDSKKNCSHHLKTLGLVEDKDFFAIGLEASGKQDIEGLLPDHIRSAVYASEPALVAEALARDGKEAKRKIKAMLFEEFTKSAVPGPDYSEFYRVAAKINKLLAPVTPD